MKSPLTTSLCKQTPINKTQSEIYIERLEQLMKLIVENYKMNLEKEVKFNNHLNFH